MRAKEVVEKRVVFSGAFRVAVNPLACVFRWHWVFFRAGVAACFFVDWVVRAHDFSPFRATSMASAIA